MIAQRFMRIFLGDYVKTIDSFFENNNFDYLEIENSLEEDYYKIWEDVYKSSQLKKSQEFQLSKEQEILAFNGISKRGKFLCQICEYFNVKNIAEVGTAEGFQFFTFSHFKQKNKIEGKVYSCDIRDVRNKNYISKYDNNYFVLGNSHELAKQIQKNNDKIDLFWIDGNHDSSAVLFDLIKLSKIQSSNAIWLFDDFDERFGSFNELNFIGKISEESRVFSLGPTSSGNPNNVLIAKGI